MKIGNLKLLYNAEAYFESAERYPDGLNTAIIAEGTAGFQAICYALALMSREYVQYRRYMGEKLPDAPSEEAIRQSLMPYQIVAAQKRIIEAMVQGLPSDGKDNDAEIDEILAEMEKKQGDD